MFGDMGSFGHSNGAEGNAGTQETGIIEKLLVSNKRERERENLRKDLNNLKLSTSSTRTDSFNAANAKRVCSSTSRSTVERRAT